MSELSSNWRERRSDVEFLAQTIADERAKDFCIDTNDLDIDFRVKAHRDAYLYAFNYWLGNDYEDFDASFNELSAILELSYLDDEELIRVIAYRSSEDNLDVESADYIFDL